MSVVGSVSRTETESFYELIQVCICFFGALLFTNIFTIVQYISAKLDRILQSKIANNKQIVTLAFELEQKKRELDSLSPTEQFAAYFKTERVYNRLKAEHSQLVARHQKENFSSSILLKTTVFVVTVVTCSVMVFYSRNVFVGHINSDYFWPLNPLLHLPNMFQSSTSGKGTPVSLFSMFCLCSSVLRSSLKRVQRKQHLKVSVD